MSSDFDLSENWLSSMIPTQLGQLTPGPTWPAEDDEHRGRGGPHPRRRPLPQLAVLRWQQPLEAAARRRQRDDEEEEEPESTHFGSLVIQTAIEARCRKSVGVELSQSAQN